MIIQKMMKENSLQGKTILVTGGGTGLGKSMATYFSELGANVIISSRKMEVLQQSAIEISSQTGNEVFPISVDISDHHSVDNLLKESLAKFSKVDVLLNNAAANFISPTERLSPRAFDKIVDIVLKGTYYSTLAFGKYWIKEKIEGNILNIITTYAWTGSGYVVPSAVSKGGILALTRSLAVEWAKYGIRLNAIAPGPFPTKGAWERLVPGNLASKINLADKVPLKRTGEHQELANLAAFLISDFAAYITGEVVTIDGGEWLKGAGQFNFLDFIQPEMWDEIEQNIRKSNKNN